MYSRFTSVGIFLATRGAFPRQNFHRCTTFPSKLLGGAFSKTPANRASDTRHVHVYAFPWPFRRRSLGNFSRFRCESMTAWRNVYAEDWKWKPVRDFFSRGRGNRLRKRLRSTFCEPVALIEFIVEYIIIIQRIQRIISSLGLRIQFRNLCTLVSLKMKIEIQKTCRVGYIVCYKVVSKKENLFVQCLGRNLVSHIRDYTK